MICFYNQEPATWEDVSFRFWEFTDTLIRGIEIDPAVTGGHITVTLECREAPSGVWRLVALRFEKIESFSVRQRPNTCTSVISHGIALLKVGDAGAFQFDAPTAPDSMIEVAASDMHVVAGELHVTVSDLEET